MGSFLVSEERSFSKNAIEILKFLAGRLGGYCCVGLLAGYLGERFDSKILRLATNLSFIFLSLILLAYLLGLIRQEKNSCPARNFIAGRGPLLMGFFLGINLCPPFLLSVTYVFSRHNSFYGLIYFLLFFLSSSVYFLPLFFTGLLSKAQEFRHAARFSGFLICAIFFSYGVYSILQHL